MGCSPGRPPIHGELLKLGIEISERSVSGIIKRNNPKSPSQTWKTFIKNHMTDMVAVDFLVVPWQNAYVERLNGSIRRECSDHIIVWNERHLKEILREYFNYYNGDRTHLGLVKQTPIDRQVSKRASRADQLVEIPKVGGLHHRYEWREAA